MMAFQTPNLLLIIIQILEYYQTIMITVIMATTNLHQPYSTEEIIKEKLE